MSILEQLRTQTKVVIDTGDFHSIKKYNPVDSTTNPSLIYKASEDKSYEPMIEAAIKYATDISTDPDVQISSAIDKLIVDFGTEILKIIPGRVSTEVDARLSFDTEGTIRKAQELISLYTKAGVDPERVLIKVSSTWEGIRAAEELTKAGIHCNMTLLFSFAQAVACADAGVQLISPFVGRILDWYKKNKGFQESVPAEEPGVILVKKIYNYFKKFGYQTEIMGASFRNTGEIMELAGCDLLTISPDLLKELEEKQGNLERKLYPEKTKNLPIEKVELDEKTFRWLMNEDAMASDKLAEGIRKFSEDIIKLEEVIKRSLHVLV